MHWQEASLLDLFRGLHMALTSEAAPLASPKLMEGALLSTHGWCEHVPAIPEGAPEGDRAKGSPLSLPITHSASAKQQRGSG